jgi:hypothetical protein
MCKRLRQHVGIVNLREGHSHDPMDEFVQDECIDVTCILSVPFCQLWRLIKVRVQVQAQLFQRQIVSNTGVLPLVAHDAWKVRPLDATCTFFS